MPTASKERMIRKQVYIESEQQRKLRQLARWWDCTEAEVIRQAIDRLPDPDSPEALDALVTERLRRAGILAEWPGDDEDLPPPGPEAEKWEEAEEEWLKTQPPAGLGEAVLEERRSGW